LSAVGLPEIQFRDPDYDENRETLIRIVTGAPTTAPIILPLLGFDLGVDGGEGARPQDLANVVQKLYLGVDKILTWEEARRIVARLGVDLDPSAPRPVPPGPAAGGVPVGARAVVDAVRLPEAGQLALDAGDGDVLDVDDVEDGGGGPEEVENAQRWVAQEKVDDNTCDNCREVHGKTYKNRAEAYKDYPDGEGYVHCTGEEYGNACRGRVVKRGRKGPGDEE
jgi:hypothetical protein